MKKGPLISCCDDTVLVSTRTTASIHWYPCLTLTPSVEFHQTFNKNMILLVIIFLMRELWNAEMWKSHIMSINDPLDERNFLIHGRKHSCHSSLLHFVSWTYIWFGSTSEVKFAISAPISNNCCDGVLQQLLYRYVTIHWWCLVFGAAVDVSISIQWCTWSSRRY